LVKTYFTLVQPCISVSLCAVLSLFSERSLLPGGADGRTHCNQQAYFPNPDTGKSRLCVSRAERQIIIAQHVLFLLFEEYPWTEVVLGLAAHVLHLLLLRRFPLTEFTNPLMIASLGEHTQHNTQRIAHCALCTLCSLAVAAASSHLLWFVYFMDNPTRLSEVIAVFLICVWLIPFGLVVSLSATENSLPYGITPETDRKTHNVVIALLDTLKKKLFGFRRSHKTL
jgi:hypothetical protein